MIKIFNDLTVSDQIQIISIVASTTISIVSVLIAVFTLRQTNKITKEANRPYISISLEYITVTALKDIYLVIKNHGQTGAIINSITFSREPDFLLGAQIFENLTNSFIAPTQTISTNCNFEDSPEPITVFIEYSQGRTVYKEQFPLNPKAVQNIIYSQTSSHHLSQTDKTIINVGREIIRSKF